MRGTISGLLRYDEIPSPHDVQNRRNQKERKRILPVKDGVRSGEGNTRLHKKIDCRGRGIGEKQINDIEMQKDSTSK